MHEAGIAANIIEIAENAARDHGKGSIRAIGLRLGTFTGVVREALEFAFGALKCNTRACDARLEIHEIPLVCACAGCGWTGRPVEDFCLICPHCEAALTIISGREMHVEYVDLDVAASTEGETNHGTIDTRNQGPPQERRVCGSQPPSV